jgi:hypothetical protein
VATDDLGGDRASLPVYRVWARVAPGHDSGGRAAGKLSRRWLRWALEGIVVQHLTVARVAEGLGVAWNTANDAVLAEASGC